MQANNCSTHAAVQFYNLFFGKIERTVCRNSHFYLSALISKLLSPEIVSLRSHLSS